MSVLPAIATTLRTSLHVGEVPLAELGDCFGKARPAKGLSLTSLVALAGKTSSDSMIVSVSSVAIVDA
jgi:hypothetical protein